MKAARKSQKGQSWFSPTPTADSGDDAIDRLLARVRDRLGMAAVVICLDEDDHLHSQCRDGSMAACLGQGTLFASMARVGPKPLIVPDATLDPRFWLDPLVTRAPHIRFYAGIPLFAGADRPIGLLSFYDQRPRSAELATALTEMAGEVMAIAAQRRARQTIARLETSLRVRINELDALAGHVTSNLELFERASATARIGVWQCDLAGDVLHWTDGVYDMFDLPRGSQLSRAKTLSCYTETSRAALTQARSAAIQNRTGFDLDVEINTAKGNHRWIRITATLDCLKGEPVRIYGMKQDITEEKILADRTRYLAEFDLMTGLANRGQFQALIDKNQSGALMLIDLDGFKQINDRFGHHAGDECLKVVAQRLREACGEAQLVARIGGDEFAVLLAHGLAHDTASSLAAEIVRQLAGRFTLGDIELHPNASVGVAFANGQSPDDLFKLADTALYTAKAEGRNTFRIADNVAVPSIKAVG
ncbi:diguanylate cyclase [Devosia rhodophyticola]|uniref:Diguanylate cyclase n=1 Tax=Devosia rhodophyticola TaxID=3026423 RepID=A0ABY7YSU4_9HYPH|nr:diguanylate cyclase [Devosia rhodophyticola]WDR04415.1 diguanylate cyclase [Devosia rhodophyticola]